MPTALETAISDVVAGRELSAEAMRAAIGEIMDGGAEPLSVAALLTALAVRGETVAEVAGAARAMAERAVAIRPQRRGLLDTCGTGGTHLNTFNISTAAALVAAAAGVPVAKHGNRAATSSSGSADVLEALGVNIELEPARVAECIDAVGIGFCYARLCHGAMKHVAPVRSKLPFRTIFNLLGPLTNPAGAQFQLLGTGRPETARKLAGVLAQLGRQRALVVCGDGQLDEVSLWGETLVFEIVGGDVREFVWTNAGFGLPECRVEDLQVGSAAESATIIRAVFAGTPGPRRDMVIANAAAALLAAGAETAPPDAARRAAESIDSGAAAETLRRLIEWTNA
ncbi:MAG: anthranilate phosphoribosyltransferase [Planctomycetes bacterium]|nr:anthranilate phosphoribosyltransferase [Planctomycetota bacterium]